MSHIKCPVRDSALKFPEETALYEDEKLISYSELDRKIDSVIHSLSAKGVRAEMRIGIVSENSSGYIILFFALLRMGCIIVPLNFRFANNKLNSIIEGMRVDIVVSGISEKNLVFPGKRVLTFNELFTGSRPVESFSDTSAIKGKMIVLTSGSTGEPKGVLLSAENNYYSALGANMNIDLIPGDKWYLILPIFHVGGIAILFRAFLAGASVVFPSGKGERIAKDLISRGITHVSMVNAQLWDFLSSCEKEDHEVPGNLKTVLVGGSAVPESTIKKCLAMGVPVYKTYGLSEMSSQVTTTVAAVDTDTLSTSGYLLKYRELSIGPGSEVLVKGKTLFEGYILNGEFSPVETDRGGWFHTGDRGYLTISGELILTGRSDNMFISGGENIFPEEIENELMKIDQIVEAVVVPVDNRKFGKRPVAFIVSGADDISRERIVAELRKNLPGFKIPDNFYCIDEVGPGLLKRSREELKDRIRCGTDLFELSD